jgi:hypothetical protein
MHAATARIRSNKASQFLAQLCKHFAHKTPAEFTDNRGRIDFQPGLCVLTATENELIVTCEAEIAADLERVKVIVADHVVRFGWREQLTVDWSQREYSTNS